MHVVNNFKGSIYMVFDYMDHDLTGLMQRRGHKFEVKHVSRCRESAVAVKPKCTNQVFDDVTI